MLPWKLSTLYDFLHWNLGSYRLVSMVSGLRRHSCLVWHLDSSLNFGRMKYAPSMPMGLVCIRVHTGLGLLGGTGDNGASCWCY